MSDPLATTFDTLVGALAAASAALGRPVAADDALVASGRAFRLEIDEHLRLVPPGKAAIDEALRGIGLEGTASSSLDELRAHEGPALVWGVGGSVFGLALGSEQGELRVRSPLSKNELRVPPALLAGPKLVTVLVKRLVAPAPLDRARVAREELERGAYRAWSRALATHPLSRLDAEGNAWTIARAGEAARAARRVVDSAELAGELGLLAELRSLFPLPDGGSLGAERLERGAALLVQAAEARDAWLRALAAG